MYYTTKTYAVGTAIIPREPVRLEQLLYHEKLGIWMIGAVRQTCSDRGPRAVYSFFFFLLAYVFFIDGIISFSIIIV